MKMSTKTLKVHTLYASQRPVTCLKFSREGDLLFSAGRDGLVSVWSTDKGNRLGTYHFNKDAPGDISEAYLTGERPDKVAACIDVNATCTELVTTLFNTVVVYEVSTGKVLDSIEESGLLSAVEWNRNPLKQEKILLAHKQTGGMHNTIPSVKVYQCQDLKASPRHWDLLLDINEFNGIPEVVKWGPLDQSIILSTDNGWIYRFDMDGKEVAKVQGHTGAIPSVEPSADRSVILTASRDGSAALWNVKDLSLIKRIKTDRPLWAGVMHPHFMHEDPEKVKPYIYLVGGQDESQVTTTEDIAGQFEMLIIDPIKDCEIGRAAIHFSPTMKIAINEDGSMIATGAFEGLAAIVKFEE